VGYTKQYLGAVYAKKRQYLKAEKELSDAVDIETRAFGATHGTVADALTMLGILYFEMGHFSRAEPLFERAANISEAEDGPDSPVYALDLDRLAEVAAELGDYPRAEGYYLKALSIQEKRLPPGHIETARTKLGLGKLHMFMGDIDGAGPLLDAASTVMQQASKNSSDLAEALRAMADFRFRKGDIDGAEERLNRALAVDAAHLGPDDPKIADYEARIAQFEEARGKLADAEKIAQKALSLREKVLGKDHPTVAASLRDVASL